MKFWLRWLANGVAIFLGLYLIDSVIPDQFRLEATWATIVAAVVLGFVNSLIRPLHRARSKPGRAALTAVVTVLINALILQVFVWVGPELTTESFLWVLVAAAFVTLLAGLINWQIGFSQKGKPRPLIVEKPDSRAPGADGHRPKRP